MLSDEFIVAPELARAFQAHQPPAPVVILPGIRHLDPVTRPAALAAITQWATR